MFGRKVKIGLALGGGGARGFAHLGALKAFEEFGIKFDRVAGTSAGSLVAAFYAGGYSWEQMYKVAKKIDPKELRSNIIPLMPSDTEGIQKVMKDYLGDINIEDLSLPFSAIAVDIKSTREVCISHGNLAKAVAGSCAVPSVFKPVEFGDMILCDGGLQNTIPSDILRYYDCDYVIAIDCNPQRTYGTDSTKFMDVISCSIRILMKANAVRGYKYADIVIQPETKRFKATKKDGYDEMIDEGYTATVDMMPKIQSLLRKGKPFKKKKTPELQEVRFI